MPEEPTSTVAEATPGVGDTYLEDTLEYEEKVEDKGEEKVEEEPLKEEEEEVPEEEELIEEEAKLEELPSPEGKPRPTYKELTKEYPELFKKFPSLRDMFFREAEYAKLYPNIEDAKEANEQAQDYKFLESLVSQGDVKGVKEFFSVMKENDEETFAAFATNYLPALMEVSPELHNRIASPLILNVIKYVYNEANNYGNEDLKNSALHIAKAVFGDHRFATGEKLMENPKTEKKPDKEREEFETEKRKHYTTMYQNFENDVYSSIEQSMRATIASGLDKKANGEIEVIPEYLKKHIINDTLEEIGAILEKDASHMSNMNNNWRYADKTGFTREAKNKLLAAYLTRAKILIPSVRGKIKGLALKGSAPQKTVRTEVTGESRGNRARHPVSAKEIDWKKTSDEDYASGKITYKGE